MIALTKASTAFGEITILQSQTNGSHIYWQGEWLQSEADCNGVSLAACARPFRSACPNPVHRTLMIGCGGGTLGGIMLAKMADPLPSSISIRSRSPSREAIFLSQRTSPATWTMVHRFCGAAKKFLTP
jgi:hypothetical protein